MAVAACGDDAESRPGPPAPRPELDAAALQGALLVASDVPSSLGDRFRPALDVGEEGVEGAVVVDGDSTCRDVVGDRYGPAEREKAMVRLSSRGSETTVYSAVRAYEPGDAETELEALLSAVEECSSFTGDVQGTELEISVHASDLADTGDFDHLAPDAEGLWGVSFVARFRLDGVVILEQHRTAVRLGDVITFSGAMAPGGVDQDALLSLTESAVERLETVMREAA
jgi:hypothetical protein